MISNLLTVFDDGEMLEILIALYHWNPRTLKEISDGVPISQDIARKKLAELISFGFVKEDKEEFEISPIGNIFIKSLGIKKDELDREINKELQRH